MKNCLTLLFFALTATRLFAQANTNAQNTAAQNTAAQNTATHKIDPQNITITRDNYGVPHIHGHTNAEVAYGLAWAHAEDDFKTIQEMYAMATANLGRLKGTKGVGVDYANQLLRLDDLVDAQYDTDVSPDFKRYLDGYCQGINAYAAAHPREVKLRKVFPITPQTILKGYALAIASLSGLDRTLKRLMKYNRRYEADMASLGSNTFAFSKNKMSDGKTTLVINAHQPLTGMVAFYEAHLQSDEGMNIHGGLFPGGVSILHGANQNLAWAHTANGIDKIDVFKLEMQPKHKNRRYSFDGKWLPLERAKAKMHIKGIPFAVGKKVFWSKYGATIKTKQGYFAVRLYANQTIKAAEQWWRMGLANNYEEFHKALEMRGLPIMNINYIDRYDTLFFIHNTVIPNRNPQYNWRGTVPGNTAQTLWDTYLPLSQNPQIRNPACGYTYNVNHSPFLGTAAADAPKPQDYPGGIASFDMRANNRSLRFEELLRKEDKISLGCLQEMRNDLQLPKESEFWHNLRALQNIDLNIHPDLTDVVTEMRLWNGSFDTLSTGASVAYLALIPLFERFGNSSQVFCYDVGVTEAQAVAYLREAQTHLRKYFGTTHLPLGKLQRLRHGNKDYAIGGCPDVLAAMYGLPQKDGTFAAARGDDFIMYVQYDKDKPAPTIQSMRAFGNSSRPNSPHYTDQMELFLRKQPRTVYSFDPVGLQQHTERVYHPTLAPPIN